MPCRITVMPRVLIDTKERTRIYKEMLLNLSSKVH
jgi:hypothetical protein